METLVYTFLIIGAVLAFIGVVTILIGVLFENNTCDKIGLYSFIVSIICVISVGIVGGIDGIKTACSKSEIAEEKIVKVVETKKEPIIDTTIVIKNGVTDTTFTYKFRK